MHEIKIIDGLRIYLSSDGYVDQFGGEKGKKYLPKRFRELLLSMNGSSMNDQLITLDHDFQKWKGDLEQVDDVLVLGLKF